MHVTLVADTAQQLAGMQALFEEFGHEADSVLADTLDSDTVAAHPGDLWVVEILSEDAAARTLEVLLDYVNAPLVIGEGFADPAEWRRRMLEKLDELDEHGEIHWLPVTPVVPMPDSTGEPRYVWVLAASTGGPNAVKQFLDHLPSNLPVAFVYAQHINSGFDRLLVKVLGKNNDFAFNLCGEAALRHGVVSIVPVDNRVRFLPDGQVQADGDPWAGHYSPSIDTVIREVAETYRRRAGVIVFTGMGNDGCLGAETLRAVGGKVWVQSPDTCTVSSMPEVVQASGPVEFVGDPVALAEALTRACGQEQTEKETCHE